MTKDFGLKTLLVNITPTSRGGNADNKLLSLSDEGQGYIIFIYIHRDNIHALTSFV